MDEASNCSVIIGSAVVTEARLIERVAVELPGVSLESKCRWQIPKDCKQNGRREAYDRRDSEKVAQEASERSHFEVRANVLKWRLRPFKIV
jgi:hypothetical protein